MITLFGMKEIYIVSVNMLRKIQHVGRRMRFFRRDGIFAIRWVELGWGGCHFVTDAKNGVPTCTCTRIFRDLTAEERAEFGVDDTPTCPQFAATPLPTFTPYPTLPPPTAYPTFTPYPSLTLAPTLTPAPRGAAAIGEQRGAVPLRGGEEWTNAGQAGEVLTIATQADWDTTLALFGTDGPAQP